MGIKQYAVHWIELDPVKGSEVSKTRPCVILSPDEINLFLKMVIVAPLTHTIKLYPSRVLCEINGTKGSIMLDQLRAVDRSRIGAALGKLDLKTVTEVKSTINEMLC